MAILHHAATLSVIVLLISASMARSEQDSVEDYSSGPFCGHYVVYAALSSLGHAPDEKFVGDRNYLHGSYGATATDLMNAIQDFGFQAVERKQMSLQSLMLIDKPVILHTRNATSNDYTHWMLFLGYEGDEVIVYDPPRNVLRLNPSELLPLWDGYGIVVSEAPLTTLDYLFLWLPNWKSAVILSMLMVVAYLLRRVQQGGVYVSALCVTALCCTALVPPSPLTDYRYVKMSIPMTKQSIPTVDINELARISSTTRPPIIIDARPSAYYALSHIPGAINLPIDATYGDYKMFLAKRALEASMLVIYCQSENCSWADDVAMSFRQFGLNNVYILRGGMDSFLKDGGNPERSVFKPDHYR